MSRTKPHVKVHVSVSNHRKTAKAWFNPETRGMLIELWRIAAEKYAGRTQDEVALTPTDMQSIAGRSRLDHNRIALSKLVDAVEYRMRSDGLLTYIIIRNFSKKQGWDDKNSTPPIPTPNPIPISESKSEEEKRERPRVPRVARERTACPERLTESEWTKITAWAESKDRDLAQSLPLIWEQVRAWAEQDDIRRPSWPGTLRTFFLKRMEAKRDGATHGKRSQASGGRRQTALEAGQELLAEYEARQRARADADVYEADDALPGERGSGFEGPDRSADRGDTGYPGTVALACTGQNRA